MHTSVFEHIRRDPPAGNPGRSPSLRPLSRLLLAPALVFAVACSDQTPTALIDVDDQHSDLEELYRAQVLNGVTEASTYVGSGLASFHGDGILTNGSFETGFTGWSTSIVPYEPFFAPWTVSGAGAGFPFPTLIPTQPQDGVQAAWHTFDGQGPMDYSLWQDVTLPACEVELGWDDRIQWVYFGASEAKEAFVEVRNPSDNSVLATLSSFSTGFPAQNPSGDTGWQSHTADLSAFSGETVRLSFRQFVPEPNKGPGQFELDHVTISQVGGSGSGGDAMAELVPVPGKSMKSKKGLFTVEFTCPGGCGVEGSGTATLNGIPVENGQVVDLRLKSEKSNKSDKSEKSAKSDKSNKSDKSGKSDKSTKSGKSGKSEKPLKIEGSLFELVVECDDGTTIYASPDFTGEGGGIIE